MTATAKHSATVGTRASRRPKEVRISSKTVQLRRALFIKLAGSSPDFPLVEPPTAPDVPRIFF